MIKYISFWFSVLYNFMVNFQGFGVAAKIRAKWYRIVLEYLRNVEWVHFGERNEVVIRRDNETRGGREDETAGTAKRRAIGWEWLGMTGNDWDWLGMTGRRANKTTGPRDCETTRLRDYGTTGLRDHGKHRRSQAFSVVRGCAWLCVAVRGCAWLCVAVRGSARQLDVRVVQMWCIAKESTTG